MSTPIAAEPPLIDNARFLEELERFHHVSDPGLDSRSYEDAFEALESGLPMDPAAHQTRAFDALESGPPMDSAAREAGAFDALENGLPMNPDARQTGAPHHKRARIAEPHAPSVEPAPAETHVPFLAAVLVLLACLTAGAAAAALVFHDRVAQITALLANR
jgi:hypothetical protein